MDFTLNTTTLKNKVDLPLTDRQKDLLRKEKGREDFYDNYIPMLRASLAKSGYDFGYACNFEQTVHGSIFNKNQIVIYNDKGDYTTF